MRDSDRPRQTVINGVAITSLPVALQKSSKLRYVTDYASFLLLAACLLAWRHIRRPYAVVQVNTQPDALVFAAIVPKLLGARVILHLKEPAPELAKVVFGGGPIVRVLERVEQWALKFADRALTVTEPLKQRYAVRGARADRITVVLTGAPPEIHLAGGKPTETGAKEGFTIISHGTIEERYGHDTILEAVALLRDELPDIRVVFTGRGSGEAAMLAMIDRLNVGDVVRFEGMVSLDRLNELLATSDVGVVSQKASDYSHLVHTNKMVDFWIFGLPVIHSRLRAVYEYYGDKVLEYYEPGDARDLARAIRRLYADAGRRAELAANGRAALREHGWDVQRKIYLGVYEELLRDRA